MTEKLLWTGASSQGRVFQIFEKKLGNGITSWRASTPQGDTIAHWFLKKTARGHEIDALHIDRDFRAVSEFPGEGISSLLVALALKRAAANKSRQVTMADIIEPRWKERMVEKLGAQANGNDVVWKEGHLTLPKTRKQPWHDFLPEELRG